MKGVEESPWGSFNRDGGGITARQLAKKLAPYGIEPCDIRQDDGKVLKGYYRAAFTDAWDRYIPPEPSRQPPPTDQGAGGAGTANTATEGDGSPKPQEYPTAATTATSQSATLTL